MHQDRSHSHDQDHQETSQAPDRVSVLYSGKPKECCGGAAVEQEKLQRICPSAFGALTPGFGLLVLLLLVPEVDNGCDDEVR